jgi:hypothetical protein
MLVLDFRFVARREKRTRHPKPPHESASIEEEKPRATVASVVLVLKAR